MLQKRVIQLLFFSGIYKENLEVDKSIFLKGQEKETTIINGNFVDNTVWVKVSSVEIEGFTISNSIHDEFSAGVYISKYQSQSSELITDIKISNCIIKNNDCGIRINVVANCQISYCIIKSNFGYSIYILHYEDIKIDEYEIYENGEDHRNEWYSSGRIVTTSNDKTCKNIEISNCQKNNNVYGGINLDADIINVETHHNIINEHMIGISIEYNSANVDVYQNIIINNEICGIYIIGSSSVSIFNNKI